MKITICDRCKNKTKTHRLHLRHFTDRKYKNSQYPISKTRNGDLCNKCVKEIIEFTKL